MIRTRYTAAAARPDVRKLASTPPNATAMGPVKDAVAFDRIPTVLPITQATTAAGFQPALYQ